MIERTSKEALVAQLLGELDALLHRVEALPKQMSNVEQQLARSVTALVDAGVKYRTVVNHFTEDAKTELTEFIERKAGNLISKAAAEQRAELTETARKAVATEAEKFNTLANGATTKARTSLSEKVIEHAFTAATSSIVTAAIVYTIMKLQ